MKKNVIIVSLCLLSTGLYAQKAQRADTVYIEKTKLDKKDNSICYLLKYQSQGMDNEIYRLKVEDFEGELIFGYSYKDSLKDYMFYSIVSYGAGVGHGIMFNKRDTTFYLTDVYDFSAIGDRIVRKSVSFDKKEATVMTKKDEGKTAYYRIKLKKIWPKPPR
jgi:hypothetical protein